MKDEPASRALELSTPRANVQNLRNLFSEDKCAPATGSRPPSLKKPNAAATPVRIPRPSLAPKPANKPGGPTDSWEAPVAKDPPAVIPCLPRVGAVSAKRASLERISAAIAQQAAIVHQAAIAQQAAELRSLRGEVASPPDKTSPEVTNNGGCKEPVCVSDEEDYETPIALSSQQPARRASPVPPPTSPPEDPKVKAKPRLPEPPAYVPQQLVRGPSPLVNKRPCWRRWPLPPTTLPAPPKPTRPPGMTCPLSSPLQSRNGTPPSVPARSNGASPVGVPLQPPPPPRPAMPKPPRLLPVPPAEEDDSVYEDTCSSPIPEYTEDEELGRGGGGGDEEELYADTEAAEEEERPPALPPYRGTPPEPPPPRLPTRKEQPPVAANPDAEFEELYEEMPPGDQKPMAPPLPPLPPPSSNRALGSLSWKGERRDYDQLGKKFGLPAGWEQRPPVDAGRARGNSSGSLNSLELRQGEPLYVLRVENNPPGKWLVRNRLGEVGYADLANIEIMTSHRSPCTISKKQQQSPVQNDDDDEAIYEETI